MSKNVATDLLFSNRVPLNKALKISELVEAGGNVFTMNLKLPVICQDLLSRGYMYLPILDGDGIAMVVKLKAKSISSLNLLLKTFIEFNNGYCSDVLLKNRLFDIRVFINNAYFQNSNGLICSSFAPCALFGVDNKSELPMDWAAQLENKLRASYNGMYSEMNGCKVFIDPEFFYRKNTVFEKLPFAIVYPE